MKKIIELHNEEKTLELSKFDDLFLVVSDGSKLILKLLNISNNRNINISADVRKDSILEIYFADFSKENLVVNSHVKLLEENASCEWHLATLASSLANKHFDVSFTHEVSNTSALMDNYGVARDKSKITFTGCNHIKNGAKNSKTNQIAKIIVFDKDANGVASPILRIDENDVSASHSAVVGQLNSDHMFYLMSRGLSREEARELITRGYLQPISVKFSDDNKAKIELAIKEAL